MYTVHVHLSKTLTSREKITNAHCLTLQALVSLRDEIHFD